MSKLFKLAAISALTLGFAGAGTTAAMAGTPNPTPSQQTVTPSPHHQVRAALWQFDFTGANIDGLQLNDVRGTGPIPMSRWSETDNSPITSTFSNTTGDSVKLRHNRLPLPVINLTTCTATFDQVGHFRIISGTGTGANFRVVPGTDIYLLRGLVSVDFIQNRHHRAAVCPLRFVSPGQVRAELENNLPIAGQVPTLVDFDVQGNAQLVRVTGPGHFFAPTATPSDTPSA
jgi:hypothetical protein